MTPLRYVGPLDAVVVYLPSGRAIVVQRGDVVDLLASEVRALTDNPDWAPVAPDDGPA